MREPFAQLRISELESLLQWQQPGMPQLAYLESFAKAVQGVMCAGEAVHGS